MKGYGLGAAVAFMSPWMTNAVKLMLYLSSNEVETPN